MAGLASKETQGCSAEIAEAVGTLMMSRTYAHMAHLATSSYAKHIVLNEFYDDVVDLMDDLAETAQGEYGKLDIPFVRIVGNVQDPVGGLTAHLSMIKDLMMDCDEDCFMSIFQEIQKLYRSTLYKLKMLN